MLVKLKKICEIKWGARGMVALYLSLLSGLIVALQYNPAHPYYSTSIIDTLVPFGSFWRSLHFYSSQLFFLLIVLHFIAVLLSNPPSLPTYSWIKLVISMLVVLLLLFTGYILRADTTGSSAGRIAENILLSVPYIGRTLDSLLLDVEFGGMKRVYVNHLVGFGLLWLVLIWPHIRRYMVGWRQFPWLILAVFTWSALIPAPMEPSRIGVFNITGPWFFIGLQELLRYVPPFWAGIVWPSIFVVGLFIIAPGNTWRKRGYLLVAGWLALYLLLTILGLAIRI
jgi:ubiquinol-cytochrome c reductase cytochrome b subunit